MPVVQERDREYVGFAELPNQVHRKTARKGFAFTLMVAGESRRLGSPPPAISALTVPQTEQERAAWGSPR